MVTLARRAVFFADMPLLLVGAEEVQLVILRTHPKARSMLFRHTCVFRIKLPFKDMMTLVLVYVAPKTEQVNAISHSSSQVY